MKKIIVVALSLFIFCTSAHGLERFTGQQHKAQLKAAATEKGPYAQYDRWPKDYFLVPQNLPFMVGLLLYQPGNEVIGLSEEQKDAVHEIRNSTVPAVLKLAALIKTKELELAEKLVVQKVEPQKLYALVDDIAAMRVELTKAHMDCIRAVQDVVPDEKQYAAVLQHARKATGVHKKSMKK